MRNGHFAPLIIRTQVCFSLILALMLVSDTVFATEYKYDALGRVTLITYDNGHSVRYSYDKAGNITSTESVGRCSSVIAGSIGQNGRMDNFRFHGESGEQITLRLESNPKESAIGKFASIRIHMESEYANDEPEADSYDEFIEVGAFDKDILAAMPTTLTVVLPETASYHIHVKSESETKEPSNPRYVGRYDFTLEGSPAACASFVAINSDGNGTLSIVGNNDDWRIRIRTISGDKVDDFNYAGVSTTAELEWDSNDGYVSKKSVKDQLSLYFPHEEWANQSGRYSSDIRPVLTTQTDDVGYVWNFDIEKSFSEEGTGDKVHFEFLEIDGIPSNFQAIFVDHALKRIVDIRNEPRYEFLQGVTMGSTQSDDSRFSLLVGDDVFMKTNDQILPELPSRTLLAQNVPNPFNPSTVIHYEIAEKTKVHLAIYDARGARINTLEDSILSPGGYQAVWLGDDVHGNSVATGVYYYKLLAGSFSQTKKLVLLK